MTNLSTDRTFPLKCSVKAKHPLWAAVIGRARGRAIEIAPQTYMLMPSYLEDYHGLYVAWSEPAPGHPIYTDKHIASFIEAQHFFAEWAQRAFQQKWSLNREHPSTYGVRP